MWTTDVDMAAPRCLEIILCKKKKQTPTGNKRDSLSDTFHATELINTFHSKKKA